MPVIATETGIAKETLYKWEKGTKPSRIADYFTLKAYLDRMENNLAEEAFDAESKKPATLRLLLRNRRPAVLQTDCKAATGSIIFSNDEPELIVDRINAPFLGFVEGVIEVTGHSMAPTFSNGCRITISRLTDNRTLTSGQYYYIIDTNWQGIVRRVYQGEKGNNIQLVSDNPDQFAFPPMEKSLDQIEAIFKIGASMRV
ncbi:hypothetical protein A4H97_29080 [Niastella yeongjuensis]|uniref:Peptidase S24/S26A/S26B/S26C domain-containing protein n=1 Tax=Niastella yeongjuensis TaxID=354355 RepID=A0A1V9ETD1_9BACT|nr:S24 family peptidase [Niastella yeongjuensis]OQP49389.1 hypothetical protein A4H97_29080 [Niastella yeongjuensis]